MSNAFQFHFQNLIHADPKLLQPAPPAPYIPPACRTSPLLHRRRGLGLGLGLVYAGGGITDSKASSTAPIRQYGCSWTP